MEKISVIVLTRPSSVKLEGCLKSLKGFGDELIVQVDADEETPAEKIAKKYQAKVIRKFTGSNFALKRNYALKQVRCDWVFYIDDDERVTSGLKEEIKLLITNNQSPFTSFAIPRRNFIFGKEFKYGGQYPDYVKRLFKKSELKSWKGELHEEPEFKGEMGHLENALVHKKHDNLEEMVEKTNDWSEVEARLMFAAKHPKMNIPRFLSAMAREFWLRMIKQRAFLDGPKGIIYALYQVFSRFVSYAKLWEMQMNLN